MYNDNLVNLIKDRFHECMKNENGGFQPEYYPNIPEKHEEKVLKHFVDKRNAEETILMIYDTSLFSKGKNGLVITDQAVYFKDTMTKTAIVLLKNWDPVRDQTEKLLGISENNAFLLAPFLDKLISDIITLKKYEGLFELEESNAAEKAAAEKAAAEKAAEEKAAEEKAAAEVKAEDKDNDDNDEDDNDEDVGLLNLLGVVLDVVSDPTYEK